MNHYVSLLSGNDSQETMDGVFKKAPNAKGVMKRYQWKELEPEQNVYDLRSMESDRAFLASRGKVLLPMIEDKSFTPNNNPCPSYAQVVENKLSFSDQIGLTGVRWEPATKAGFIEMLSVVGKRFGRKAGFGGICTQESAPSMTAEQYDATGYTAEKYAQYYIDISNALASTETKMYWFANFIPRGQQEVQTVLDNAGRTLQFGGPDLWPDSTALNRQTYPYYVAHDGPKFIQISNDSYRDYTNEQLLAKAAVLGVSELFWVYLPAFNTRAVQVIAKG